MTQQDVCIQGLVNAIILMAVDDYRRSIWRLCEDKYNERALSMAQDCESFFLSDWFSEMSNVDGQRLLDSIRSEMGMEAR